MTPIDRARCFAALSGPFDPVEAFAPRAEGKSEDVAVVASQLAVMCDTHPQGAEGKWLMRTSERRDILKMLRDDNALDDYIAARRGAADAETGDLLDAILGNGLFAPADIEQAVASLESRGLIERIVVAVDRGRGNRPGLSPAAAGAFGTRPARPAGPVGEVEGTRRLRPRRPAPGDRQVAEATDREGAGQGAVRQRPAGNRQIAAARRFGARGARQRARTTGPPSISIAPGSTCSTSSRSPWKWPGRSRSKSASVGRSC